MSFSFDPSSYPLRLRVEGPFSSADVLELERRLASFATVKRPALLLDARAALAPVILWTKARRTTLEGLLRHVGPLAIVATDSAMLNAVRLALHPFGSDIVWRNFATIEDAAAWLGTIELHGRPIWNPSSITAPVSEASWDRLWTAVRAKRWQSALQPLAADARSVPSPLRRAGTSLGCVPDELTPSGVEREAKGPVVRHPRARCLLVRGARYSFVPFAARVGHQPRRERRHAF